MCKIQPDCCRAALHGGRIHHTRPASLYRTDNDLHKVPRVLIISIGPWHRSGQGSNLDCFCLEMMFFDISFSGHVTPLKHKKSVNDGVRRGKASSASLPIRPRWSTPQAPSLGGPRMERSCYRPGQDVGGCVEPVCVADRWRVG